MARSAGEAKRTSVSAEVKRVLETGDEADRAALAVRGDVPPEVLYFLAGDSSAKVRSAVAGNLATPAQADLNLSRDPDESIRLVLARKIAAFLAQPDSVPSPDQVRLFNETLGALIGDRAVAVRRIIAVAAAAHPGLPSDLVYRLAEDEDDAVAIPVLQDSPDLTEAQLAELVARYAEAQRRADDVREGEARMMAVAGRKVVSMDLVARLVESDDDKVIETVIENDGADISEDTLEDLAERAETKPTWHAPLVSRPRLTSKAVLSLVRYVAEGLLRALRGREDLDAHTLSVVEQEMKTRLSRSISGSRAAEDDDEKAMTRAAELLAKGRLDSEELSEALMNGDETLVAAGLAILSDYNMAFVRHVRATKSAKGVVSLAWKAGMTPRFAGQLQATWAHIPRAQILPTTDGTFPLSKDAMEWHLEFLEDMRE